MTPTEGSYQQSLFGKFLVWSLLIFSTVAVQDYRTSLTVSEGHGYPLISLNGTKFGSLYGPEKIGDETGIAGSN
jgi:hypothetical protein